ncbi:hypothetical protein HZC08_02280, partial [Candidatus Micrarchaeota archaeon]|nr:hypothetical protein [Candidatus Micrarchaeota archaeon]
MPAQKNNSWILIVSGILFLVILLGLGILFLQPEEKSPSSFSIKKFELTDHGRIGENAYLIVNSEGGGKITLLALNSTPSKEVHVLTQKGIGTENLNVMLDKLQELNSYGYEVKAVGSDAEIKNGVYVILSGAMPVDVLKRLESSEYSGLQVIYLGKTDLIYDGTAKKENWYEKATPALKSRMSVVEKTVDEVLASPKSSLDLSGYILESSWALQNKKEVELKGGMQTVVFTIGNQSNLRLIHENKILDYSLPLFATGPIEAETDFFPWENSKVEFGLNKTNGTAHLLIYKDGSLIQDEQLIRVITEDNFQRILTFSEPGDYILKITDGSGAISSVLVHVKDMEARLVEIRDNYYTFNLTVDGVPVEQGNLTVRLKGSENSKQLFITNGLISVPAKLAKGKTVFVLEAFGGSTEVNVESSSENVFELYLTYGPIGILIILAIFFFARINKKPIYTLRVGNVAQDVRKELRVSSKNALEAFRRIGKELGIIGPLKAQEFALGIKKHLTEGAEVTEGNEEEILKKM